MTLYLLTVVSSRAIDPPAWWNDPIKEDAANYFFTASGVSETSSDDALRIAQNNALEQIVARLGGSSTPAIHDYLLANIRGWKIHAKDEKRAGRNNYVWVIVRYPKDEFNGLLAYLANGERMFQDAIKKHRQKNFNDAIVVLDRIVAEYPLSKQPVFGTERALLLLADCYEQQHQYRKAVSFYESILTSTRDEARKTIASRRIDDLKPDAAWKDMFFGRRTLILCAVSLDGECAGWPKMAAEFSNVVKQYGANPVLLKNQPTYSRIVTYAREAEPDSKTLSPDEWDMMLVFVADGELRKRANPDRPTHQDVQFSGHIRIRVMQPSQTIYSQNKSVMGGWNPLGRDMCMDVLALGILKQWSIDMTKHMERE